MTLRDRSSVRSGNPNVTHVRAYGVRPQVPPGPCKALGGRHGPGPERLSRRLAPLPGGVRLGPARLCRRKSNSLGGMAGFQTPTMKEIDHEHTAVPAARRLRRSPGWAG
jgi:hypothetical protein